MHNFLGLVVHFHFLLGVTVIEENVDVGNDVVGELMGEFFHGGLLASAELAVLLNEFVHSSSTGATCGLVGSHVDTAYRGYVVDGFEGNDHLDGSAVGVSDDVSRGIESVVAVDFGHYEGHIDVHAESAGVVDHKSAMRGDYRSILLRDSGAGRSESDVDVFEIVGVVAKFLNGILLTFKRITAACRTGRAE